MAHLIDIHTHILPGLDDGAANWEDTLRLARAAVQEGIAAVVATPHHANGSYHNAAKDVVRLAEEASRRLNQEGIPLQILHGQEIRVHTGLLEAWEQGELLTLGGSKYLLIELPSGHVPAGLGELVHELAVLGMVPVIAHPERNAAIAREPKLLEGLIEGGAIAQMTTHSLLGGFGRGVEKTAWALCGRGLVHLVSSDAHHAERRGFRLREAYQAIGKRLGDSYVRYYQTNASRIVSDMLVERQMAETPAGRNPLSRFIGMFK